MSPFCVCGGEKDHFFNRTMKCFLSNDKQMLPSMP